MNLYCLTRIRDNFNSRLLFFGTHWAAWQQSGCINTPCFNSKCQKVTIKKSIYKRLFGYKNGICTLLRYGHLVFCSFNLGHATQFDTLHIWKKKWQKSVEKFLKFFSKIIFWIQMNIFDHRKKKFFGKIIFLKFHHFFQMRNVSNCVVLHKLKLQKTKCPYLINMLIPFL